MSATAVLSIREFGEFWGTASDLTACPLSGIEWRLADGLPAKRPKHTQRSALRRFALGYGWEIMPGLTQRRSQSFRFNSDRARDLAGHWMLVIGGLALEVVFSAVPSYAPPVSATGRTEINAATRFCAVFGHPVRHSASPAMQNAAITELGLNWRYLACPVHPDDLRAAIDGARAMKFIGLNLTVPHKIFALKMADKLDESAQAWGAVNTVRFEARDPKGRWLPLTRFAGEVPDNLRAVGFNTDADALARALREELHLKRLRGASVLLLGAGGAGRMAALKLAAEHVGSLFLVNRTVRKAERVATEIRRRFAGRKVIVGYPRHRVDLVINATSLGLKPEDGLPFDARQFSLKQAGAVYDMIYRPAETGLLKAAKAAGCRAVNGLGMLLYQGAAALELWSGKRAPLEPMRRALEKEIYDN